VTLTAETGFRLESNPDTVRAPNVAFIEADRAAEADTPKFIPVPPDFCAEVLSPNDRATEVAEKVHWWLDHGVRLVRVVDPENETVTAYERGGGVRINHRDDTIEGGDVFPGLALPVDRLFK